jgi:hypothetical protein
MNGPYPTADTGGAILIVVIMLLVALLYKLDKKEQ